MKLSTIKYIETVKAAKSLMDAGTPMIVFDTETTGVRIHTDKILSLSAIKVAYNGGLPVILDEMDLFFDPKMHIPEGASKVNGIWDRDVMGKPTIESCFPQILDFFGEHPFLCGYNSLHFDQAFMERLYENMGKCFEPICHVDVFKMAKEKLELPSYKLAVVAHELGEDGNIDFHRSSADVIATYRVFAHLKEEYTENELQEAETMQQPLKIYGARYWDGPSYKLQRVYVMFTPKLPDDIKVFYDAYTKEWKATEGNPFNLEDVRQAVLEWFHASDEAEMIRLLRPAKQPAGAV